MEFLTGKEASGKIRKLLTDTKEEGILAVAFWGKGAIDELGLKNWHGKKPLKIVCNLPSGGVNPAVIKDLQKIKNVELLSNDKLHAKVYWTEKGCVLGSANASANGLALEGSELTSWIEANVLITDSHILKDVQNWLLQEVCSKATQIDNDLLKLAEEKWKKRRNARSIIGTKQASSSLLELPYEALINRNIFVASYNNEGHTSAGKKSFKAIKTERHLTEDYDFYEDGIKLKPDITIIDCAYEKADRGTATYDDVWKVTDVGNDKPRITLLKKMKSINIDGKTFKLSKDDKNKIEQMVKRWLKSKKAGMNFDKIIELGKLIKKYT